MTDQIQLNKDSLVQKEGDNSLWAHNYQAWDYLEQHKTAVIGSAVVLGSIAAAALNPRAVGAAIDSAKNGLGKLTEEGSKLRAFLAFDSSPGAGLAEVIEARTAAIKDGAKRVGMDVGQSENKVRYISFEPNTPGYDHELATAAKSLLDRPLTGVDSVAARLNAERASGAALSDNSVSAQFNRIFPDYANTVRPAATEVAKPAETPAWLRINPIEKHDLPVTVYPRTDYRDYIAELPPNYLSAGHDNVWTSLSTIRK